MILQLGEHYYVLCTIRHLLVVTSAIFTSRERITRGSGTSLKRSVKGKFGDKFWPFWKLPITHVVRLAYRDNLLWLEYIAL